MKRIPEFLLVFLTLLAPLPGRSAAAGMSLKRIEPFTDEYTVMVARLNLDAIDVGAAVEFAIELMPPAQREVMSSRSSAIHQAVRAWLDAFREAGGRELYGLVSLSDLGMEPPLLIVIPMAAEADATKLQTFLRPFGALGDLECDVIQDCVVAGKKSATDRLKRGAGHPPRDLRTAFAAMPDAALQAVYLPYEGSARVIEELMPTLPGVVGGGPSTAITRGLRWAAISLQLPPEAAMVALIRSQSEADATALRKTIVAALDALGCLPEIEANLPQWGEIRAALTPTVAGDSLVLKLDRSRIADLTRAILVPALAEARSNARQIATMNNLKQIGLALIMYAEEHDNRLPPHLADALPYLGSVQPLLRPDVSIRPPSDLKEQSREARVEWVNRHAAVTYVRAGAAVQTIETPAKAVLAYARPESPREATVLVLFADGHVESVARDRFEELMAGLEVPSRARE